MNSYENLGKYGTYLSAYGIAVKHGYGGTEQEWLAALKGDAGESIELVFDRGRNSLCYKTPSQTQWKELISLGDLQPEIQGAALQEMEILFTDTKEAAQAAASARSSADMAAAAAVQAGEAAQAAEAEAAQAAQQAGTDAQTAQTAAQIASAVQEAALTAHAATQAARADAQQAAGMAKGYGTESGEAATLAESWAAGGTGIRAGEDADNAKYWANLAKNASDVGPHAASAAESEIGVHGIRYYGGYLQCMENGEWVDAALAAGKESVVVGTVKSGHTARDCDFLCPGTGDQLVIAQALAALGSCGGGSLFLLEGEYTLTGAVTVNLPAVRMAGAGENTILKRKFKSSYQYVDNEEISGGILVLGEGCRELVLTDFILDGAMESYAGDENAAISSTGTGRVSLVRMALRNTPAGVTTMGSLYAADSVFEKVYYSLVVQSGVLTGNSFTKGNHTIKNCTAENNRFQEAALVLRGSCRVHGNTFQNTANAAIHISGEAWLLCGENIMRGCRFAIYGADIAGGTITGNIMQDNDTAVWLMNSRLCTLQGNTIYRGQGKPADYSGGQYNVLLYGCTGCTVWGNVLPGKDAVDMTDISVTTNSITGNRTSAIT